MNVLSKEKQVTVISALAEGNSIRSIERITGIHRDTIMKYGFEIGEKCGMLMDIKMRNLECTPRIIERQDAPSISARRQPFDFQAYTNPKIIQIRIIPLYSIVCFYLFLSRTVSFIPLFYRLVSFDGEALDLLAVFILRFLRPLMLTIYLRVGVVYPMFEYRFAFYGKAT